VAGPLATPAATAALSNVNRLFASRRGATMGFTAVRYRLLILSRRLISTSARYFSAIGSLYCPVWTAALIKSSVNAATRRAAQNASSSRSSK
jgi:hypothetical protein